MRYLIIYTRSETGKLEAFYTMLGYEEIGLYDDNPKNH